MRIQLIAASFAVLTCASGPITVSSAQGVDPRPPNGTGQTPAFPGQTDAPERKADVGFETVTVVDGLQNPWSVAFLPGGKMLITERPGRLRVLGTDGKLSEPVAGLPPVDARGQGGLLDVILDPNFGSNRTIYWSYAEPRDGGVNNTAVAKATLVDGAAPKVENVQVIYHQTPSLNSAFHFGSRLVFGRDGTLFVTQGDRSITEGRMQSQRMDGLLGKIVRLNTDGSVPKDNPFVGKEGARGEIWAYGIRNVWRMAFDRETGDLWAGDVGQNKYEEIDRIILGGNYGWNLR